MSVKVTPDNVQSELLESPVPVLADFYSDSCLPCKRLSPVLAELEAEYGEAIRVAKINAAVNPGLAERFSIRTVPTLVFYARGEERGRRTGMTGKEDLREILNHILEESK